MSMITAEQLLTRKTVSFNKTYVCQPTWSIRNGGARRDRTDDLKLAKLALSQLSYGPDLDQPDETLREAWWAWEDLNFRPHAYQARALTN